MMTPQCLKLWISGLAQRAAKGAWMMTMTREEFMSFLMSTIRVNHPAELNMDSRRLADHDQAQRAVIDKLQEDLETAERALRSNGYRKDCDIPACNCGPRWNHGGYADQRLREISDALHYANGATILQRVEQQAKENEALRETLQAITTGECGSFLATRFPATLQQAKQALKEVS